MSIPVVLDPLFPYQLEGSKFLAARTFALLADEQGVGKSAQSVRAAELVHAKKILVVCKAVARMNWQREFEKWWGDPATFPDELHIVSYESIHKVDPNIRFDVLIVDESHSLKEPNAQRTQKILGKLQRKPNGECDLAASGKIHLAKYRWFLTGTPTPNHAGELWTLLFTGGLTDMSYEKFVSEFCVFRDTAFGRQITGTNLGSVKRLQNIIRPISIRRTKQEVLKDMPPIHYSDLVVPPGPVDLATCESFVNYTFKGQGEKYLKRQLETELAYVGKVLNGRHLTFEAIQAFQANLSNINTLRRFTGVQKVEPVADLIRDELESKAYDKIVVFGVHKDTLVGLRDRLKDLGSVLIYGGTSEARRNEAVDNFQNRERPRIFLGNIQSAGTSITLTAAHQVLFIEQSFVPGDMAQAAMRCHRVGQDKAVSVRFVGLENSIDEYIARIIRKKTSEITALMAGFGMPQNPMGSGVEDNDTMLHKKQLTMKKGGGKLSDLL